MLGSAIVAILEPYSLVLTNSVAWQVASALKRGDRLALVDEEGDLGAIVGVTPVLQPVLVDIAENRSILQFMKVHLDLTTDVEKSRLGTSGSLSLMGNGSRLAAVAVSGAINQSPLRLFMTANALSSSVTSDNLGALQQRVSNLVETLWQSEPIRSTTTKLHLTTTGQVMSAAEIRTEGLSKALLQVANGSVSAVPQLIPLVTFGFRNWEAGVVSPFTHEGGSSSCPVPPPDCEDCASCSTSDVSCDDDCTTCDSCASCAGCGS
jgi:hypothetical protein